jgi:hypothetical protein
MSCNVDTYCVNLVPVEIKGRPSNKDQRPGAKEDPKQTISL